MDNVILIIIAIAIFFVPEFFCLRQALRDMKEGISYKEWDESKGEYVEMISNNVKFWETDSGKLYLWVRIVCSLAGASIILWIYGFFA